MTILSCSSSSSTSYFLFYFDFVSLNLLRKFSSHRGGDGDDGSRFRENFISQPNHNIILKNFLILVKYCYRILKEKSYFDICATYVRYDVKKNKINI